MGRMGEKCFCGGLGCRVPLGCCNQVPPTALLGSVLALPGGKCLVTRAAWRKAWLGKREEGP